ncbi:BnaC02g24550D [Brassica napus]|uniref:BnaC02g24550D protein n=1 Tax=Brassica napus TaxID=3708 RepID=A0A078G4K9_BRANA|nr:BnaC02g24550D [Brassica napus]
MIWILGASVAFATSKC